ncbi:DUF3618 domain-containing protein [Herbiconiux sp. CPCC 205763]|uniref:DUF3618 domain-containing protein n=1 Tax=Herbiconiux aconitum TaxID=2970913 RepID=A0ABT2GV78_9MICO|nr:DUF3618 domain-containing protein [Herbiconiux aconitum]MCS5720117.1 DUF3618 domain-containing protein [Herbiconiux aconitum]
MAGKKSKKDAAASDELSIPAAVAEVAKAAVAARSVRPDPPEHDPDPAAEAAEKVPERSREEVQADIVAHRAELAAVLTELERRLDVPTRVKTSVGEIVSDPVQGARKHPKTVALAVAAAAGLVTGVVLLVRAIAK